MENLLRTSLAAERLVGRRVVRHDGQDRKKVNGPLVAEGDVVNYFWPRTGPRIVYVAEQQTDGVREIFSSKLDGSDNVKISGSMVGGSGGVGTVVVP